jgi:UDP-3-O-[3-hydroxymyristoyl] glucosamine N-acyltransferase
MKGTLVVTVRHLAELVAGTIHGDGDLVIQAARPLAEAQPGDITFVVDNRHAARLSECPASAAVVFFPFSMPTNGKVLIQVPDPLAAFVTIVSHLRHLGHLGGEAEAPCHGIDPQASIHPTARIGEGVSVYPFAVIGAGSVLGPRCQIHAGVTIGRRCRLGDEVILYPNVVLYDETVLGHRVIIHANAVIGADGFGYRTQAGRHVKVPQLGHVEIDDDVEIGACTTIDRGTFEATRIGAGTKIDNLVQIAHNCQIGRHNLLVSQIGIAGSSGTGDYVVIAGQAGVADHVQIGAGAIVGGQAGVTRDVPAGQRVLGNPATPEREQQRILITLKKLPELHSDVRRIKQALGLADQAKTPRTRHAG